MERSNVHTDQADRSDRRPLRKPVEPGSRADARLRIEHHVETGRHRPDPSDGRPEDTREARWNDRFLEQSEHRKLGNHNTPEKTYREGATM